MRTVKQLREKANFRASFGKTRFALQGNDFCYDYVSHLEIRSTVVGIHQCRSVGFPPGPVVFGQFIPVLSVSPRIVVSSDRAPGFFDKLTGFSDTLNTMLRYVAVAARQFQFSSKRRLSHGF